MLAATGALATPVSFAAFQPTMSARTFEFLNQDTTVGGVVLPSATLETVAYNAKGMASLAAVPVNFNFLLPIRPEDSALSGTLKANFEFYATSSTAAGVGFGNQVGQVFSGSFSFTLVTPVTLKDGLVISNLLSGTFTNAELFGDKGASSASFDGNNGNKGETMDFSSDYYNFANTVTRDSSIGATGLVPAIAYTAGHSLQYASTIKNGKRNVLARYFQSTPSGNFSADPAPVRFGGTVPEPRTWAMVMVGIGLVGLQARRRARATA